MGLHVLSAMEQKIPGLELIWTTLRWRWILQSECSPSELADPGMRDSEWHTNLVYKGSSINDVKQI